MAQRVIIVLACLLLAQAVAAETITVTYHSTDPGDWHLLALDGGSIPYNPALVGFYHWQDLNGPFIYEAVCIDAETSGVADAITYELVPLTEARMEPGLISGPLSQYRADLLELFWGQYRGLVGSNAEGAAFGLAVYEIVYDGDSMVFQGDNLDPTYDFEGGVFEASDGGASAIWSLSKDWLQALDLNGPRTDLIAWKAEGYQDQITEDGFTPVPVAPTSWGLLKALF